MITVLTCRGTGEVLGAPENLLNAVTGQLDPAIYEIGPDIDYPASIGPANPQRSPFGCTERQSIDQGVTALVKAIHAAPNRVGILGYSLGAEVVTRFLEAKGRGEYPDCDIAWAAMIANPLRKQGDSIDPDPVGFGINGQHDSWPDEIPTWEVANPVDAITSCPPDSPLRTLADTVSAFGFADLGGWTTDLADRIRRNRWQAVQLGSWTHPLRIWELWSQAAELMQGYLTGGAHTTAYVTGGYCDRLAVILNRTSERG
ncbi:PE-PPE domain-containing protein [Nocardia sp. CDC153]|uniref:PE-PPE domain-containing protein n=1 Tax=Nocardia sp. CDC153 TaxID=3112167 RepID=UPI002DBE3C7C|nr:PE-PPE domain-containing protein [Nocardia sp. CDC153]MEC3955822.1 PE-PPE domain-containing protein [Nocardia sp. CDC153]